VKYSDFVILTKKAIYKLWWRHSDLLNSKGNARLLRPKCLPVLLSKHPIKIHELGKRCPLCKAKTSTF